MVKHQKFEGIPPEQRRIHYTSDRLTLKKGCQFIREIGNKIGFPNKTVLTAQWYFRKVYQTRPLSSAPFLDIALTCTILASKVEESFEKIKTVLVTAFLCLNGNSFQGRPEDIKITEEHKDRVIQYERDVLISVAFNFNLSHPHDFLIKLSKSLEISKETAKKAWELLNTWYETEDFILWKTPHSVAIEALMEVCAVESDEKRRILEFTHKNQIKINK